MPTHSIDLGRGVSAWLEGKDNDVAINSDDDQQLIVLTQPQFSRLVAFVAEEGKKS